MQTIIMEDWGIIDYGAAWERQEAMLAGILAQKKSFTELPPEERPHNVPSKNRLIFCRHPHVYTLGKSGRPEHLLLNETRLESLGATFHKTNRGGDITYHGPGQIVGYPIFDLENFRTDLGWYMRSLEEAIIKSIAHYGIEGERLSGATGVWLDADNPAKARKICAMGVRCSRWVTMHGFALNANTDLSYFGHIIPCGIVDKGVTSISAETGKTVDEDEVKQRVVAAFAEVFEAVILQKEEALTLF